MSRKITLLLTLFGLMFAWSFIGTRPPVAAAPLAQATATPDEEEGEHEHAEEEEEGEHEHSTDGRIDAGDATIRIVSPADGATLTGNSATVEVETTNFELGEGRHWHLYVDGQEVGMSEGNNDTQIARDLAPGEHTIEVTMANAEHQELDTSDAITIHVEAEAGSSAAPVATSDNTLLVVAGIVVGVLVVAGAGFALARRK